MLLFHDEINPNKNWLPYDGEIFYFSKIMEKGLADNFLQRLLQNIDWRQDEIVIYGKKIITKRKVAWYGDIPFEYKYSKTTKTALPWTNELLQLKSIVEQTSSESFNSCLLNLYHTGEEGMSWHSDSETELKKHGAIASLSLGAERKFAFKHRQTQQKIELLLEHGSLLIMKGTTQSHWLHQLPISKKISSPRINLTFRTIVT